MNEIVVAAAGRIYLTKDSLTRSADFARMESRLEQFREVRRKWDPEQRISSALARRLMGDPA